MSRTIRNWCVVIGIAVAAVVLAAVQGSPPRELVMPDRTVLRIERVGFGKRDAKLPDDWYLKLKTRVMQWVPKRWAPAKQPGIFGSGPGSWNQIAEVHTNNDALHIWISRRQPVTRLSVSPGVNFAELVDEHGCPFLTTQTGGIENAGSNGVNATWLTFEAFPRNQKQFRLRLYDQLQNTKGILGEFVVNNPAPRPGVKTTWSTEPLPVTKRDGDVAFTLTGISIRTNGDFLASRYPNVRGPAEVVPAFTVMERGQPSSNWWLVDFDLFDSTGNFASEWPVQSRFLCPEVPAWKLVMKFYGTEGSMAASNETWVLKGLKVPEAGGFTPLNEERYLMGMKAKTLGFAGAGKVVYSNDWNPRQITITKTAAVEGGVKTNSGPIQITSPRGGSGDNSIVSYQLVSPHLGISLGPLMDDRVLTVTATDEQGRRYETHEWFDGRMREVTQFYRRYEKNPSLLMLDLPPEVKTVDLMITMHRPRVVEFVVKPPGR